VTCRAALMGVTDAVHRDLATAGGPGKCRTYWPRAKFFDCIVTYEHYNFLLASESNKLFLCFHLRTHAVNRCHRAIGCDIVHFSISPFPDLSVVFKCVFLPRLSNVQPQNEPVKVVLGWRDSHPLYHVRQQFTVGGVFAEAGDLVEANREHVVLAIIVVGNAALLVERVVRSAICLEESDASDQFVLFSAQYPLFTVDSSSYWSIGKMSN
jgi:hypothetical protein